jgi:uncharacterized protein DUF5681
MTDNSTSREPASGTAESSPAEGSYAVGYGKPPRHTQFKRGVSGNPRGRPKGRLNLATVLQTELKRTITVREGSRNRRVSKGEAFIVKTVNGALNNDPKAGAMLITLMRAHGMIDDAPDDSHEAPLTQDDAALVADFLQRQFDASSQPDSDGSKPKGTGTAMSAEPQKGETP